MTQFITQYGATRPRRLTALFIAGNFAFFVALLVVMFYQRSAAQTWPAPFHFASLLMVAALTMFSLAASVTIAVGERAARLERSSEPAVRWIASGISCWLVFLVLEVVEWARLVYLEKLGPDTSFGSTFLMLTVSHWIAVTGCVAWFCFVAFDVKKRDILAAALYSHFLNFWWIVLVFALYFFNADLQGL